MIIRDLIKDDKTCVIELMKKFYNMPAVLHKIPESNFESTCDEILNKTPYARLLVAEENGNIAGYCLLAISYSNEAGGMCVFIEEIMIDENYRNKGHGKALINFVFNEEKLKTANNKYMLLQLKKEAFRLIDALTYQYRESNFKPLAEEMVFGSANSKYSGIELGHKIKIAGKIDRIDTFKDYYRVIDYKTGYIDLSPKTTYYGGKVQLFAYLKAMQGLNKRLAGAFYLPIRNVFVD